MASYDTYTNADIYFATRLYVQSWTSASTANKTKALAEASLRIDRLQFRGHKVDDDQDLEFPRYVGLEAEGDEVVPDDIKYACFEVAFALLDGIDPDQELQNQTVLRRTYANVTTAYKDNESLEHFANGIPSYLAWSYLKPYLSYGKSICVLRRT